MASEPRTSRFIEQAKRVRDYGVRTGSLPNDDLILALVPFDVDPGERDVQKVAKLRVAARRAYSAIDELTLQAVFRGEDPTETRASTVTGIRRFLPWQRVSDYIVLATSIFIILLAFHYTYWTKQAEIVLKSVGEHASMDYSAEVRRMVEIGLAMEDAGIDASTLVPDIFSTNVSSFVAKAESLQYLQVSRDRYIHDAVELEYTHSWMKAARDLLGLPRPSAVQHVANEAPVEVQDDADGDVAAEPPVDSGPREEDQIVPDGEEGFIVAADGEIESLDFTEEAYLPDEASLMVMLAHYKRYLESSREINQLIGAGAGTDSATFAAQRATAVAIRDRLRLLADVTNHWYLPAIYGALGAAVFSVVRYLNVFLTDPPLRMSLLRIMFGAFTGITISMLFGPSSIFTMEAFTASTTLFLVCFLFGYSIDSFLALLRRADTYVNSAFSGPQR